MKKTVIIALLVALFAIGIVVYMTQYQNEQSDALDYSNVTSERQ